MKNSIWNILTVVFLMGACLMAVLVLQIYTNPATVFNLFRVPTIPPTVVIPSATPTLQSLPPTWTPTPLLSEMQDTGLKSSSTPLSTLAAYVPSQTPSLIPSLTETASLTPRITNTPGAYDCALTNQLPPNGSNFSPGAAFYATWTLENIGWYALDSDDVDYRYLNGTHLHKNNDAYDLPQTVMRSSSISLVVPMLAPTAPGSYAATWAVVNGKHVVCSWTIQVNVVPAAGTPPG